MSFLFFFDNPFADRPIGFDMANFTAWKALARAARTISLISLTSALFS